MAKLYPVMDYLTFSEKAQFNLSIQGIRPVAGVHAKPTGEFRCPRKGEWYLSGAIVEAYRAANDLPIPFQIAKLVKTRTETIIVEE